ncbi:MAG TPA: hypothetical protein VIQ00_11485 [Chitinophagaceae bacterium]
MNCRKHLFVYALSFLIFSTAYSQLHLPATNNNLRNDIAKVLQDYPNKFKNLVGDTLLQNPQVISFTSTIQADGAQECSVAKYSAGKRDIYSWQALMLTSEDFEDAIKTYKKIYTQLNNVPLKISKDKNFRFSAKYEPPAEERKFNSILFAAAEPEMKKLKLELNMRFEFPEWKILILVYEREREDDERGRLDDEEFGY